MGLTKLMECEVQAVYRNLRYRILIIDEKTYILDLGLSFWKILFPFFFWALPNPVFKIENQDIVKKLKVPKVEQPTKGSSGVLGASIAVLLATLLRPIMDYFDIHSSPFVNSIIATIVVILMFLLFFYISDKNKKNLYRITKLEKLSKERLWIGPKSVKHFFQVLFYYLFCMGFIVLGFALFIEFGNALVLFFTVLFMLFLLIISIMTVRGGKTTVKFIRNGDNEK